jgi:N-acetylneuraminate lyase
MNPPKLSGLIAAPFTSFHPDGSLRLDTIEAQAHSLVANRVRAVFVCGTTGECASLTVAERMQIAAHWRKVAGTDLQVLVHAGHTCLSDSKTLAAHAQEIGAAGVGCFAPFFFKPTRTEDLVAHCAQVAAAAPSLPFYFYQIPSMTGVSLPAADFLRIGSAQIPNLAGVKFTHENLMDYAACVRAENGRFDALFGRDEILLAGLSLGARGAIGSTYNFIAPIYHLILEAFAQGDLVTAQRHQARANAVIEVFIKWGGLPAGKAIMQILGLDCGPVRLPLRTLDTQQIDSLQKDLEAASFFEIRSTL